MKEITPTLRPSIRPCNAELQPYSNAPTRLLSMSNLLSTFQTLSTKWSLPSSTHAKSLQTLKHSVHLQTTLLILISSFKKFVKQFISTTSEIKTRLETRHENISNRHESLPSIFSLLRNWFLLLLRLRDSQTYLQSGEARHIGDVARSKSTTFKSLLKSKGVQGDGYTSYFKSEFYSGASWDEYFDDKVGLRVRLIKVLGEGKLNKLMERTFFESKVRE